MKVTVSDHSSKLKETLWKTGRKITGASMTQRHPWCITASWNNTTSGFPADRSRILEIRIQSIFWASSGSGWKNADFTEIHPCLLYTSAKLPLVDEVIELDEENRKVKKEADDLRASRNKISKQIGALMGQGKKEEAEEVKKQVTACLLYTSILCCVLKPILAYE